jgi:hypothetical protein
MNFSIKNCKQIVNNVLPVIHIIFTVCPLTFELRYAIILIENEREVNEMYYIDFVSWQNPRHHYAPRAGLFSTRKEAQKWADEWNKEMEWIDDRRAVVEKCEEDY